MQSKSQQINKVFEKIKSSISFLPQAFKAQKTLVDKMKIKFTILKIQMSKLIELEEFNTTDQNYQLKVVIEALAKSSDEEMLKKSFGNSEIIKHIKEKIFDTEMSNKTSITDHSQNVDQSIELDSNLKNALENFCMEKEFLIKYGETNDLSSINSTNAKEFALKTLEALKMDGKLPSELCDNFNLIKEYIENPKCYKNDIDKSVEMTNIVNTKFCDKPVIDLFTDLAKHNKEYIEQETFEYFTNGSIENDVTNLCLITKEDMFGEDYFQ